MYLLNVATQQLEDIHELRPYAILSHALQAGETVYFHQVGTESVRMQPGYEKVETCCEPARQGGLKYIWTDTCCANANNSAAYTETTTLAYTWYQQAHVCYTYLDDVDGSEDSREKHSTFKRSRWFRLTWTLGELSAPKHVLLRERLDNDRNEGRPFECIHRDALEYPERVPCFSIATRMSWARGRTSTKHEDRVYALMGLFGVNLPILYGEGETRTFLKLQNEILKTTDDQSIFAWHSAGGASTSSEYHSSGLLADTSKCFADCGNIQQIPYDQWSRYCAEHFCSKNAAYPQLDILPSCRGVQATLPVRQRGLGGGLDALLACARGPAVWNGSEYVADLNKADPIYIRLRKSHHGYERVDKDHLESVRINDFQKFSLRGIHICASRSLLDVPAYQKWFVDWFL
ncbi:hypothetical protein EDC04DRAFT_2611339 [Pisolithus marmoratus]|nr:hypothetical protein EDC04DRAFT_2611339 [Pisolithus marmoratus]